VTRLVSVYQLGNPPRSENPDLGHPDSLIGDMDTRSLESLVPLQQLQREVGAGTGKNDDLQPETEVGVELLDL
jgi:hypothetical protein